MNVALENSVGVTAASHELWASLTPAIVGLGVVLAALVMYAVRTLVVGGYHDAEMDARGIGGLTTVRVRHFFAWTMRPLWRGLSIAKVPPNALTTLAFGLAAAAGVGVAVGRFALGGWLFLAAGALDFLDGRVARETGRATRSGAVLDSVVDRYCECAFLVGLSWYYRGSWVLAVALLSLTGSMLVPYVRARGEAIGVVMKDVGVMQRPERIVALGVGVAFAPVVQALFFATEARPSYHLTIVVLCVLALTAHATALQRMGHLLGALGGLAAGGVKAFRRSPRAILVSSVATGSDYLCTHSLVSFHAMSPPLATVVGCTVGGLIAFVLSRNWAFDATRGPVMTQAARYLFVSGTTAILNAGGVALALLVPNTDYRIGWVITRALVFVTWSFPLLNEFAFPPREREEKDTTWNPVTPTSFGFAPSPLAVTGARTSTIRERVRSSPTASRPLSDVPVKAVR
ncbi:MAG TPA: CDP-alcohol phosphatidyltransferase family protein [Polyangiaceae bacterium]|nr:CDP-alcohol phosphatidyltransferase family protein [Polyangiaceae bacterium]